jgi:hypothetical protein
MVNIIPTEGLCNRLRVIFSYFSKYGEINVYWGIDEKICNCHFNDVFEPIEKINILNSIPKDITYRGYSSCLPWESFKHNFLLLKPKKSILDKINFYTKLLNNNYNACHIRRTDHVSLARKHKRLTTDLEFINFIKNSEKSVYVATDNKVTQNILKRIFGNKVIFNEGIKNCTNLRKSSLEDAIIDIIICSNADKFKGSGFSSFSQTISILKEINYFNSIILPLQNSSDLDK